MDIARYIDYRNRVVNNCAKVIVGKNEMVELVLIGFICGGHVLLEDQPGTGKTMLLRSFAKSIGGDFKRVQFTPDLLPSDLTGINFFNQKTGEFEFRKGPLFANVVLADEINRATPRTQSSLLEAMEEKQISMDGTTYKLEEPFMVMATQNSLESRGTFPLPEAQVDRFFMRLSLGYMTRLQEMEVIARPSSQAIMERLQSVVSDEDTMYVRNHYHEVTMHQVVLNYLMDIIEQTRKQNNFVSGVSTRGAIALYKASQVKALFNNRDYVIPEDVKEMAPYVLSHRIALGSGMQQDTAKQFIQRVLQEVVVPVEQL